MASRWDICLRTKGEKDNYGFKKLYKMVKK